MIGISSIRVQIVYLLGRKGRRRYADRQADRQSGMAKSAQLLTLKKYIFFLGTLTLLGVINFVENLVYAVQGLKTKLIFIEFESNWSQSIGCGNTKQQSSHENHNFYQHNNIRIHNINIPTFNFCCDLFYLLL